jgi:WD40 repeat protein
MPTSTSAPVEPKRQTTTPEVAVADDGACFPIMLADQVPVTFTPDSKMLFIRTLSGAQIFNLETMKEETSIESTEPVLAAALSPNGEILAWSLEDHSIQLIQVSDGKLLNTLLGHTDIVFKLRFSSDSDRLFSGSHDGSVRIWDTNGELINVIETNGEVLGIGISADSTRLATVPFDGPVTLWDLTTYERISTLGGTGGFDTSDAVFSPDGNYLAADLATGLYLWRLSDGKSLWEDLKNSMAITFSPDGKYLAYAIVDDDNKVLLSAPDGSQIIRMLEGMQGSVWDLFFSPDSSIVAAVDSQEMRIWRAEDGQLLYIGKASCP